MDTFTLYIDTVNDAFLDANLQPELARILRKLADTLEGEKYDSSNSGRLRDINGNTVGSWRIT